MDSRRQFDFNETASILDKEDEATLAAIDRGIKAAEEGRLLPMKEVRERMLLWISRSSSPKIR